MLSPFRKSTASIVASGAATSSATTSACPAPPHKDFSDLYEKMSGKGASASEAHRASLR